MYSHTGACQHLAKGLQQQLTEVMGFLTLKQEPVICGNKGM